MRKTLDASKKITCSGNSWAKHLRKWKRDANKSSRRGGKLQVLAEFQEMMQGGDRTMDGIGVNAPMYPCRGEPGM